MGTEELVRTEKISWGEFQRHLLFQPSLPGYQALLRQPGFRKWGVFLRIFLFSGAGYLLAAAVLSGIQEAEILEEVLFDSTFLVQFLFCGPAVASLVSAGIIFAFSALSHGFAWLAGGRGAFRQVLFLASGIWAPLLALSLIIGLVPWLAYFIPFVFLYGAALTLLALKAVHGLTWVRTALAGGWLLVLSAAGLVIALYLSSGRG